METMSSPKDASLCECGCLSMHILCGKIDFNSSSDQCYLLLNVLYNVDMDVLLSFC